MPRDVLNAHLLCFSTATFLLVAKMRLYVLLMKQEENAICNVKDWVVREASNQDALQEAGTFRYCQERKPRGRGGAGGSVCYWGRWRPCLSHQGLST